MGISSGSSAVCFKTCIDGSCSPKRVSRDLSRTFQTIHENLETVQGSSHTLPDESIKNVWNGIHDFPYFLVGGGLE